MCARKRREETKKGGQKEKLTINVPLFKKLRDIIFFWWDNHFMSHFEGHFEGAKTFFDPLNLGVKNVQAPSKCPEKWLIK